MSPQPPEAKLFSQGKRMRISIHILGNSVIGSPMERSVEIGPDGRGVLDFAEGTSLADLEQRLELHRLGGASLLHNGAPVAKEARATARLSDGDEVVVLPPIEGGA